MISDKFRVWLIERIAGERIKWWIADDAIQDMKSLTGIRGGSSLIGGALVALVYAHEKNLYKELPTAYRIGDFSVSITKTK